MVVVGVFMAAAFSLIGRNFKQGLSHPAFSLAPSSASSVHSIIISTSIADWTPSIAHLGACLRSIEECEALKGASILVVADCIPSAAEVAALPEVDAAKWAPLWHSKRASYDEYLSLVEAQIEALGRVRLVRLEQFGHLVGTVRRGIDESGASSDDVVLIMQHDLALASPSRLSQQVKAVTATLRDPQSPVQYVLLNRDCNDAPRSVSWLRPEPVVADETAAAASVEAIEAARPEMRYGNVGMETDKGVLNSAQRGGASPTKRISQTWGGTGRQFCTPAATGAPAWNTLFMQGTSVPPMAMTWEAVKARKIKRAAACLLAQRFYLEGLIHRLRFMI
eukprot:CAMPEP_0171779716 /NCGR_PEP_ID=MMETSP0991-20121206/59174_1 /TAXON_ID=483369 /ORGANISM="non described non described, Strain CCMP2098" /LENGTH=335 /DNA_ID=CAMNT_0012386937 /DNA_START=64 /DNA_END=1072 /DNA_ORIENTATION=+